MMEVEIKLPQTVDDCDLVRLAAWSKYVTEVKDIDKLSENILFRIEVVSIFSGLTKKELVQKKSRLINKAYVHCIKMMSEYEQKEPSGVIEVNGTRYVYDKEIHNISTGQVIDIKLIEDIYKQPYELMAALYIEEGMTYNQEEDNKVVNPNSERIEIFKDEPIGSEFLDLLGFFLRDYIILNLSMYALNVKQMKMEKRKKRKQRRRAILNGLIGRQTSST